MIRTLLIGLFIFPSIVIAGERENAIAMMKKEAHESGMTVPLSDAAALALYEKRYGPITEVQTECSINRELWDIYVAKKALSLKEDLRREGVVNTNFGPETMRALLELSGENLMFGVECPPYPPF